MIKDGFGVNLIDLKVTPLQAAFLDYLRQHPYCTFTQLKIHEGVPLEAQITTSFGVETVRFDRIAREEGLIK